MFGRKKKDKSLTVQGEKAVKPLEVQTGRVLPERRKKASRPPDPYFTKLAKVTRRTRYAVTVILVVFTVVMAFLFSNEITGEKLKLLLRNASFSFPGEEVAYTTVRYDADRTMDYAAYREYFAVGTGAGLRLYDHRGNVALQVKAKMNAPAIDSGKDYILMYDREGKTYLVCNSVTELYEGSETFPIYGADVCDNGRYLILTSSSTYLCVMKIYNRSFKLIKEISVDRYPISAELSDDGNRLLLLCVTNTQDGKIEGHVCIYDVGGEAKLTGEVVTDGVPLAGKLTSKGAAILYHDRVAFYGNAGADHGSVGFEGKTPGFFTFNEKTAAVSFEVNSVEGSYEVLCCDLEKEEFSRRIEHTGRIAGLNLSDGLLFICGGARTVAVDLESGKTRAMTVPMPEKIMPGAGDAIFFCYRDKAENMRESVEIRELTENSGAQAAENENETPDRA